MHKQQLQLTLYFPDDDDDAPAMALRQTAVKPSPTTTVRDLSPAVLREAAIAYTGGKIKDLPAAEQPVNRLQHYGPYALSTAELLAILLGTPHALTDAEHLLSRFGELSSFATAPLAEITESPGIGQTLAARIKAALELGRRMLVAAPAERPVVRSPADAANLLMAEMGALEQEHLRTVLLDTRNRVIDIPTIYIGSLNTAAVRVGEVFKHAIRQNAASVIIVHNHPSSDPSPSPDDVQVTRMLVEAGQLLGIDVADHIIVAKHRYVSLRERGLGFK